MELSPDLATDLIKLAAAFLLTSVFGAWVASIFQNRTWRHQQIVNQKQEDKEEATKVFDEISSLLDRRLYRYRQIVYAFRSEDTARVDVAFDQYRTVLFEWNDNLNRNYSRVEIYFGAKAREEFEEHITADIIWIGTLLERIKNNKPNAIDVEEVWERINQVNARAYEFDKSLLRKIERSEIGQFRTQSCRCN